MKTLWLILLAAAIALMPAAYLLPDGCDGCSIACGTSNSLAADQASEDLAAGCCSKNDLETSESTPDGREKPGDKPCRDCKCPLSCCKNIVKTPAVATSLLLSFTDASLTTEHGRLEQSCPPNPAQQGIERPPKAAISS
ncbi:MAG: hypothetical protein AAGB34_07555 [Planctomycetota bacterium]